MHHFTNRLRRSLTLFLGLLAICPFSSFAADEVIPSVTILADPSLTLPITEIARTYARDHQVTVSTAYAPSKEQSQSIEAGMEADIFITSRARYINDLRNQGLIDVYSLTSLIKNRLVLAGSLSHDFKLNFIPQLPLGTILERYNPNYVFAIGDSEYVTTGSYALDALFNLGLLEQIEPRLVFLQSLEQLHGVIKDNNFGFTYASAATQDDELNAIETVPEEAHKPIIYQGVVVAGENMSEARKFLDHLRSPQAIAVFERYGFFKV